MNVRLIVASANSTTKQIRLGAKTLVGRSAECNLRIASGLVSRRHCLIKVEGESVLVRDLGSSNGTRVNGEPVEPNTEVAVCPGSALTVGPLKFILQFAAPKQFSDEDTEWLPRLPPDQTGSSAEVGNPIQGDIPAAAHQPAEQTVHHVIQSLITHRPATGEETKDVPAAKRHRSRGTADVAGGSSSLDLPIARESAVEFGKRTLSEMAKLDAAHVLDEPPGKPPANPAETPADALKRRASETHLFIEEDDLRQMNLPGNPLPGSSAEDSDSFRPDGDIDEELRKFLSGS